MIVRRFRAYGLLATLSVVVAAFGATTASAMGEGGWNLVPSPSTGVTDGDHLYQVACPGPHECWAAGWYQSATKEATLILNYDERKWTLVPPPPPPVGSIVEQSYGVACSGHADCWIVGDYGTGSGTRTLIDRWNGAAWLITPSPNAPAAENFLSAVTCLDAEDCWAVGGTFAPFGTLTEHWDGSAWLVVPSPNPVGFRTAILNAVTCLSASNCWAVGSWGSTVGQPLIEHFNGLAWTIETSPVISQPTNSLSGVTCASASDCWAVGGSGYGTIHTLIENWDGSRWNIVPSPAPGGPRGDTLQGVSCASLRFCRAVGSSGYMPLILAFDGGSWTVEPSPSPAGASGLAGVDCVHATRCWAVGDSSTTGFTGQARTLIEERTHETFDPQGAPAAISTET
jgi:hypothetical protein